MECIFTFCFILRWPALIGVTNVCFCAGAISVFIIICLYITWNKPMLWVSKSTHYSASIQSHFNMITKMSPLMQVFKNSQLGSYWHFGKETRQILFLRGCPTGHHMRTCGLCQNAHLLALKFLIWKQTYTQQQQKKPWILHGHATVGMGNL